MRMPRMFVTVMKKIAIQAQACHTPPGACARWHKGSRQAGRQVMHAAICAHSEGAGRGGKKRPSHGNGQV